MTDRPDDYVDTGMYHLVRRAQTGHGFGMRAVDDRLSDTVFMHLWVLDLPDKPGNAPHGQFAMRPDDAELLGQALIDTARQSREAST